MLYCDGLVIHSCICFLLFSTNSTWQNVQCCAFRAEYIGYSSYMVRYLSFCFSGFIAGIAGTLFVINYELVLPKVFSIIQHLISNFYWGHNFLGPIIGASIFSLCSILLSKSTEIWPLYQGNYTNDFSFFISQEV